MVISWSEQMSVGVPMLDADHKTLIGLINHLHRSLGDSEEYAAVGSVLRSLEDYAANHFTREERMMEACRCPQVNQHQQTHRGFVERVGQLRQRYDDDHASVRARDCLAFLNTWLINHICTSDMGYRAWLIGHSGAQAAGEDVAMAGSRRDGSALDWRRLRVLVVDDNLNFCEILGTILQGVGITSLTVVHDVAAAKVVLADTDLDLLICDWHIGAGSGLDLVKWLRREDGLAELPVLMLSGHERMVNRDAALLSGADEFMEKPVSARGLLVCLARLAAGRRRS